MPSSRSCCGPCLYIPAMSFIAVVLVTWMLPLHQGDALPGSVGRSIDVAAAADGWHAREPAMVLYTPTSMVASVVRGKSTSSRVLRSGAKGWMLEPSGIFAELLGRPCSTVHFGIVKAGFFRGNHRHTAPDGWHEVVVAWGARGKMRAESAAVGGDRSASAVVEEVRFQRGEVIASIAPPGFAHAIVNSDLTADLNVLTCTNRPYDEAHPTTDFRVWSDAAVLAP